MISSPNYFFAKDVDGFHIKSPHKTNSNKIATRLKIFYSADVCELYGSQKNEAQKIYSLELCCSRFLMLHLDLK